MVYWNISIVLNKRDSQQRKRETVDVVQHIIVDGLLHKDHIGCEQLNIMDKAYLIYLHCLPYTLVLIM